MIGKIFIEEPDGDFIVDCLVLCENENSMWKVIKVINLGAKDSYIKDRIISNEDYFFVNYKDLISLEGKALIKYKEKHPEYFL